MTEVLPQSEYGRLALSLSIAAFFQTCISGPLVATSLRFFSISTLKKEQNSFFSTIKTILIFLIASYSATALAVVSISFIFDLDKIYALSIFFALVTGIDSVYSGIQTAKRSRVIASFHQGLGVFFRFSIGFLVVNLYGGGAYGALIGYILAGCGILISQMYFLKEILYSNSKQSKINQEMLLYGSKFAIFGFFSWLQSSADRWSINYFLSIEDVGSYSVVYQLGYYPMILLSSTLMQFIYPIIMQESSSKETKLQSLVKIDKYAFNFFLICLVAVILGELFHPFLFKILTASTFRESSKFLSVILFASGLFSVAQILSLRLELMMNVTLLAKIKIINSIIGALIIIAITPLKGLSGVVYGTLTTSILYLISIFYFSRRLDEGVAKD